MKFNERKYQFSRLERDYQKKEEKELIDEIVEKILQEIYNNTLKIQTKIRATVKDNTKFNDWSDLKNQIEPNSQFDNWFWEFQFQRYENQKKEIEDIKFVQETVQE